MVIMSINKFQRARLTFQPLESHQYINIIFSETSRPIELNFHLKTPYDKLAKFCTNSFDHMTKMADMPLYGKTFLKKSSSQEPDGP